jgi:hypothetical protein
MLYWWYTWNQGEFPLITGCDIPSMARQKAKTFLMHSGWTFRLLKASGLPQKEVPFPASKFGRFFSDIPILKFTQLL